MNPGITKTPLRTPEEMGEFINVLYGKRGGYSIYGQIVSHFLQQFPEGREAEVFAQELLNHCGPSAAQADISLSSLTTLASHIVTQTKALEILDQTEIIMFIHRSIVKSSQRKNLNNES